MKTDQFKSYQIADIGDYLKVFACSAVISQPIMSLVMDVEQPVHTQDVFGVFYNLVKYTAPAFIFGILYTTIRTNNEKNSFSYAKHMRTNWSNLFVPTIWWTLIYLLGMPWLQQVNHFNNIGSFCWQFINGNAAPALVVQHDDVAVYYFDANLLGIKPLCRTQSNSRHLDCSNHFRTLFCLALVL